MSNFIYLVVIITAVAGQKIIQKPFTKKTGGKGVLFFTTFSCLAATLFFIITSKGFSFDKAFLPYSVAFAFFYALATVFTVVAVSSGPLSLTALFISYSLVLPTLYGVVFLKDNIDVFLILGIILWVSSLYLINKKIKGGRVSLKWIISVLLAFIGNGFCSIVQKGQQIKFGGEFKNEFMVIALIIATLAVFITGVIKERNGAAVYVKFGIVPAIICGVLNGVMNLFVMILSGEMPVSVMFPIISAGSMILSYLASTFVFKEKLTKTQIVGFFVGVLAVALLNV